MTTHDAYLTAPALHPRLEDGGEQAALAGAWQRDGCLCVEEALVPGLAAELAPVLARLPVAAFFHAGTREMSWRCAVGVPPVPDPQYPECVYRLLRFLGRDLPALASAVVGRPLIDARPGWIEVSVLRKGSFLDAGVPLAPPGGVDYVLGLTATRWPAGWGGTLDLIDPAGRRPVIARALGGDTLHLFEDRAPRIPVIVRHVEGLLVRGALASAGSGEEDTP